MNRIRIKFIIYLGIISWLITFGPLKPYLKTLFIRNDPQILLILGGDIDREKAGASLAKSLNLPLIISGGSNPEHAKWLLKSKGLNSNKIKLDYRAKDTLSNFTSLIDDLYSQEINHVLVITSEGHFLRAMSIGYIVAGSRGIRLTGISVQCFSNCLEERLDKSIFDVIRAITWVTTGKDLKEILEVTLKNILYQSKILMLAQ